MNIFKNLGGGNKRREPTGPLSGRTLQLPGCTVKVEAVLGEGGFATIYRAVDVITQRSYALKHFMLSGDPDAELDVMTEAAIMKALGDCPYTLTLRSSAMAANEAFLLLDLCQGTLAGFMAERGASLSDADVVAIFLPVARAVAALHALDPAMTHRDVKAENVLRTLDGRWVLCDFGSSSRDQKVYSSAAEIARQEERIRKHTTPAYRAPELWDLYAREFIGTPVDVWSLGCLLFFIAYGRLPFDGDAKLQILNGEFRLPEGRPQGVRDLITACLATKPEQRITVAEVAQRAATMGTTGARRSTGGRESTAVRQQQQQQAVQAQRAALPPLPAADPWGSEFDAVAAGSASSPQPPQQQQQEEVGWANFASYGSAATQPPPAAADEEPDLLAATVPSRSLLSQQPPSVSQNGRKPSALASRLPSNPSRPPSSTSFRSGSAASAARPSSAGATSSGGGVERPGSSAGVSRAAEAPAAAAGASSSADALAGAMDGVQLGASQWQEHCQVMEQLLEERNKEVGMLREELQRHEKQLEESTKEMDKLRKQAASWQRHAASGEAETAALRREIESLQAAAAESTAAAAAAAVTSARHRRELSSADRVASFPLSLDGEGAAVGGTPMRRNTSLNAGQQAAPRTAPPGRQTSFFGDLNPLG